MKFVAPYTVVHALRLHGLRVPPLLRFSFLPQQFARHQSPLLTIPNLSALMRH
jgi:hypothetical protein